jgi:hypothetical protein
MKISKILKEMGVLLIGGLLIVIWLCGFFGIFFLNDFLTSDPDQEVIYEEFIDAKNQTCYLTHNSQPSFFLMVMVVGWATIGLQLVGLTAGLGRSVSEDKTLNTDVDKE